MLAKEASEKALEIHRTDVTSIITCHIGEEVFTLFLKESFLSGWKNLYAECSWSTVFQSQEFVTTWYQIYREEYTPIVIMAEYKGKITGLLTLAVISSAIKNVPTNGKVSIMGAGLYDAEYHAWLTSTAHDDSFIKAALLKINQKFPYFNVHFRFIPPRSPLHWIEEPYWNSRCVLQPFSRPLVDMSDPDFSKIFHKTEFNQKLKKLKRLGEIVFEHITTKDQFSNILDDLILLYDFRRGAMFNSNPFKNEPLKSNFLFALFEKKLLHVTLLKVNNEIFASLATIVMGDWVHLSTGINLHTPFKAKFYSPGFLHFNLLVQQLSNEGISVLDLSPGGDFYKDRLANKHDQVYELVITDSFLYRFKRKLRKQYHERLIKAGKWPMGVELSVSKRIYLFKEGMQQLRKQGLLNTVLEWTKDLINPPKDKLYILKKRLYNRNELLVHTNNLRHLLGFKAEGTWMTRWEFLEDAMRRFEVGQNCYTFYKDENLLASVWLSEDTKSLRVGVEQVAINFPKGAALLHGVYYHPFAEGLLSSFLAVVTTKVIDDREERQLFALINSKHKAICHAIEAIGFESADNTST